MTLVFTLGKMGRHGGAFLISGIRINNNRGVFSHAKLYPTWLME